MVRIGHYAVTGLLQTPYMSSHIHTHTHTANYQLCVMKVPVHYQAFVICVLLLLTLHCSLVFVFCFLCSLCLLIDQPCLFPISEPPYRFGYFFLPVFLRKLLSCTCILPQPAFRDRILCLSMDAAGKLEQHVHRIKIAGSCQSYSFKIGGQISWLAIMGLNTHRMAFCYSTSYFMKAWWSLNLWIGCTIYWLSGPALHRDCQTQSRLKANHGWLSWP